MPNTSIKHEKLFHLGLCMAGSISAGAYIAGVVDYLIEALENWEMAREAGDPTVPDHQVVIDLMGGSSGGGITSAISYFALRDQLQHAFLANDGKTVTADPDKNILWKIWVELNESKEGLLIDQLLSTSDIGNKYVASALNTSFIEDLVKSLERYIEALAGKTHGQHPKYINPEMELFISLFNITGIKYKLFNKANTPENQQSFFAEHRDLVQFRWQSKYEGDGRIPLDFTQLNKNLPIMLAAAKATSAFPVGLRAVILRRPAKYIWDNPFFGFGRFGKETIHLGENCNDGNDIYVSLHSDSGVANNEPVELSRDLLYMIHERFYKKQDPDHFAKMNETEQAIAKSKLHNASVIMIDPFPATDFTIDKPGSKDDNLVNLAGGVINAMNSQLLFDAKQALNAYDKNDYGLSIIAPSKSGLTSDDAIACGSLRGFGGFLSKEFRVHDFFLGRHNCQSFLRKYFVVDLDEQKGSPNYNCVASVIDAYKNNPAATERFGFNAVEKIKEKDGENKTRHWVPIIPEVTMKEKIAVTYKNGEPVFTDIDPLPLYEINRLPADFLDKYETPIKDRLYKLINNLFDKGWQVDLYIKIGALLSSGGLAGGVIKTIKEDFQKRNLMEK